MLYVLGLDIAMNAKLLLGKRAQPAQQLHLLPFSYFMALVASVFSSAERCQSALECRRYLGLYVSTSTA